ncbi:outer membrane beta-barrel protein [Cognatiyoonia sp. IB215446]|uniref:outer membrane protein n=1 Tax=Cognatiyoonia sp. IB215446 TaxID=3097355 RepID=UPI002A0F16C3|nr:outer membrane beta-barrel protein [Cognatiyoonia sp. IB215446]MDX8350397.1 outer membrane beta-barrel protein [Cognatiyoonia sp. IB215446]
MKRNMAFVAAFGLVFCSASISHAQDFYGSVFGGIANLQDTEFDGRIGGNTQSVDVESDTGFGAGIALGRTLANLGAASLRAEVELSYSEADADEVAFSGNGPAAEINVDGSIQTTRLFANLIADFETGTDFKPYVGAGLGAARSDINVSYGPGVALSDESDSTSAQLILGSAYALSDTTRLFGDVRFIRDFDVEVDRLSPTGTLTGVVSDDIDTVSLNVGLSFAF